MKGGLGGRSAPTATQDQMVADSNNAVFGKKQYRVVQLAAECGEDLARMLDQDRVTFREGYATDPRLPGVRVPSHWYPNEREGTWRDYDYDVVPYSMAYQTPDQKYRQLLQVVNEVLIPLTPILQSQGKQLNADRLIEAIAELRPGLDIRGLYETVESMLESGAPDEIRQSPVTRRETVRRSEASAPDNPMMQLAGAMQ